MSLKQSCFKSIIKSDLKRSWWVSALATLFIFMSSTSPLFSSLRTYDFYGYVSYESAVQFCDRMFENYSVGTFVAAFVAISLFSYVNKVNSVSFFHSLPTTRNSLLFAHITSSAILITLPMLLNSLVSFFAVGKGIKPSWVLLSFAMYLLYSFLIFFLTLVVTMLTGVSVAGGIFTLVVIFLPIFVITFVNELCSCYLYGFSNYDYLEDILLEYVYLSPEKLASWHVLVYIALIGIFAALSFFIYNKRHLENFGEVIAFTNLKGLFKVLFGLCAGVLSYWYFDGFWGIKSILTMLVFGVLGVIIAHMLANKSFSLRGVWKSLAVTCGFIAALFAVFFFDLFGYENKIPEIDDIEYAEIGDLYYEEYDWFEEKIYDSKISVRAVRKDKFKPYFMTKEEIQMFLDLHTYAVEHKNANDDCEDPFVTNDYIKADRRYFKIVYHLNNGDVMERDYYLPIVDLEKIEAKIYSTDTYRKWKYPILDGTEKKYKSVSISDKRTYYDTTENYASETDEAKRIIEALIKDRENINYDRMKANEHGGMVDIEVSYTVPYVSDDGKEFFRVQEDTYSVGNYDVNTWALLDELDVFSDERWIELSDVRNIAVNVQEYYSVHQVSHDLYSEISYADLIYDEPVETSEHYDKYYYSSGKIFEDASAISELLTLYCYHHNGVLRTDDDVVVFYLSVRLNDDIEKTRTIAINVSELPETLSYLKQIFKDK